MRTPPALVALAFKKWVEGVRDDLGEETTRLTPEELDKLLQEATGPRRRIFIRDMTQAMSEKFAEGAVEAGFGMDADSIRVLAANYAANIVDYSNKMTSEAAAEAYQGIINRKKTPKEAFGFMKRTFGADRRAVRSLLKQFDREEPDNPTLRHRPSRKQKMMDRYVAAAIDRRANMIGEEEAFGAGETSKALIWNLASKQGLTPEGAQKRWVTARDELVCQVCGPMNNVTVPLDTKFSTPKGDTWAPHMHPNCRCTTVMVVKLPPKKKGSAFSRIRKTESDGYNPYRAKDGQFATRNENTWVPGVKPVSQTRPVPRVRPVSPVGRVRPVQVLERPTRPSQTSVDARFDQMITSLYDKPQIETSPQALDLDVEWALERAKIDQQKKPATQVNPVQRISSLPSVKLIDLPKVAPTTINAIAVPRMADASSLNTAINVALSQPRVKFDTEVDVKAAVVQQIEADTEIDQETKVELVEEVEKGTAVRLDTPLYGIHSERYERNNEDPIIGAGGYLWSDKDEMTFRIYEEYAGIASEVANAILPDLGDTFTFRDSEGQRRELDYGDIEDVAQHLGRYYASREIINVGLTPDNDYDDDPYGEEAMGFDVSEVARRLDMDTLFDRAPMPYVYRIDSMSTDFIAGDSEAHGFGVHINADFRMMPAGTDEGGIIRMIPEWDPDYIGDED